MVRRWLRRVAVRWLDLTDLATYDGEGDNQNYRAMLCGRCQLLLTSPAGADTAAYLLSPAKFKHRWYKTSWGAVYEQVPFNQPWHPRHPEATSRK